LVTAVQQKTEFPTPACAEDKKKISENENDQGSKGPAEDSPPPTFETMPDLVLAHIASFLTPGEYLDSLQMACPSVAQKMQGYVQWPRVELSDSLDTIRLAKMVLASKVAVVSCVDVRAPEDVNACPVFYENVKKLIEGEAVRELRVSQVSGAGFQLNNSKSEGISPP
jgi:hypothetical protein